MCFIACKREHEGMEGKPGTIVIENVLQGKPLVESGMFKGSGAAAPVILPGEAVSFSFSAAKGQRVTFSAMYGWSNDLFFAPGNPGIALYNEAGDPVNGDVSSVIRLWDNGTRINQAPGMSVMHPGAVESKNIREVNGVDDQGNTYLPASALLKATLHYDGNSYFTLTLKNTSGGTANETPVSPGVWAVSYIAGTDLLDPQPLYQSGSTSYAGLTKLAETGDNAEIYTVVQGKTGIFTPLSPVLVVIYRGENPLFKVGESDRMKGLKKLAQTGNPDELAASLQTQPGIKKVYILADPENTVLLPSVNGAPGGKVSQAISLAKDDRIAIATMYGFSNDWFFSTADNGIAWNQKGDVSEQIRLYDNGTAMDQFPGAGNGQQGGMMITEKKLIIEVPNPNTFTTLPPVKQIIKVTLN
ncbi:hypothetical protein GFS24_07375 [Chitinophaga sp. SYP-B3965]|nr:hypothetical protein [Chitinophaga sp. SYP-B3965]